MLHGSFTYYDANSDDSKRMDVLIKLPHANRNIGHEKEVYAKLKEKKAALSADSTGCVIMYPSRGEYLVMQKFGRDIRAYINPHTTKLTSNLKKLMSVVACLHNLGYVHCDLKPANFLVYEDDCGVVEFKLCDLDSATAIGEEFPLSKYTKAWVSPEVYFKRKSMDCILYHRLLQSRSHTCRHP